MEAITNQEKSKIDRRLIKGLEIDIPEDGT
jgi:hypothetical protein